MTLPEIHSAIMELRHATRPEQRTAYERALHALANLVDEVMTTSIDKEARRGMTPKQLHLLDTLRAVVPQKVKAALTLTIDPKVPEPVREEIQRARNSTVGSIEVAPGGETAASIIDENTSDGYHTFKELYAHRHTLFLALCRIEHASAYVPFDSDSVFRNPDARAVWRSRVHSDGSTMLGWFVMGIGVARGEQITYHLPDARWNDADFAKTLDRAPEFDGHTSADVLARLETLYR